MASQRPVFIQPQASSSSSISTSNSMLPSSSSSRASRPKNQTGMSAHDRAKKLSKALSYILRHGAIKEGFDIRSDGFVKVSDLLANSRFTGYTFEEVQAVVRDNDKQRFTLMEEQADDGQVIHWIKANQGQSIELEDLDLQIIHSAEDLPVAVHGTFNSKWPMIAKSGLKRMARTHIHMSPGLLGQDGVISGMRKDCEVYIYINVAAAMKDGIVFEKSPNNVILSRGLDGVIVPKYFERVVDEKGKVVPMP
ncbi:hypothetical protein SmJEL517_g01029 [Synchytrium microbalum]|uniref:2'-phosphotransferase n=1 Tax=Synchytrium microbalum TaxID=1806994 RepID=A0A507CD39_9FUNG|nr:uncharacterized protein SmJEL517_g01029 [Synchytrium microbalum]TPX37089.1 hypothetical protein SmJEL517_g01029 [Synchytrium microbalum]